MKSSRTEPASPGILIDYAASGEPIGLEITAPQQVTSEQILEVLARIGMGGIGSDDRAPLRAA